MAGENVLLELSTPLPQLGPPHPPFKAQLCFELRKKRERGRKREREEEDIEVGVWGKAI